MARTSAARAMSPKKRPVMSQRILPLLSELRGGLQEIYEKRLRGLYLFGSYARGEEDQESDVDVLVVLDDVEHYGAEVDRTSALTSTLSLQYGVSISKVFVREREWRSHQTPFLANVQEEAIPT